MFRFLIAAFVFSLIASAAGERVFEIDGMLEPKLPASVSIFGANEPFAQAALADSSGRFRFTHLKPGAYTLTAMAPGRGEARITIEAGPGTADARGRVRVKIAIPQSAKADIERRSSVAAAELKTTDAARREFEAAQKALARRDSEAARKHLENAVTISPGFAVAWNTLGTIAYQTGEYERAADCFRHALAANPGLYEPLVNLGGVLINLNRLEEARRYNQHAVLVRPDDALANSQLGITFFELGQYDRAEAYLKRACQLDPAHFSHPQLVLAQIHIRENRRGDAALDLENFLKAHPDAPDATKLRQDIAVLLAK